MRRPRRGVAPENWWADETGATNTIAGDEAASSSSSQVGHFVSLIPASGYQLSEIEGRLRSSGAYVPVAHLARSPTGQCLGDARGVPSAAVGCGVRAGAVGELCFTERGQYLHLGMTLSYVDPAPPGALGAAAGTTFTLSQSRRIRFYERNYFDHPAFGVIAMVSPAQVAASAARAVSNTPQARPAKRVGWPPAGAPWAGGPRRRRGLAPSEARGAGPTVPAAGPWLEVGGFGAGDAVFAEGFGAFQGGSAGFPAAPRETARAGGRGWRHRHSM